MQVTLKSVHVQTCGAMSKWLTLNPAQANPPIPTAQLRQIRAAAIDFVYATASMKAAWPVKPVKVHSQHYFTSLYMCACKSVCVHLSVCVCVCVCERHNSISQNCFTAYLKKNTSKSCLESTQSQN